MKFGIMFASTGPFASAEGAAPSPPTPTGVASSRSGRLSTSSSPTATSRKYPYSDSGKIPGSDDADIPDPLIWLAYAAGITNEVRSGHRHPDRPPAQPGGAGQGVRHPRQAVERSIRLGHRRRLAGRGVQALGLPFDDRGPRTDDYVAAMRALWTQDKASYDGPFASFDDAIQRPSPSRPVGCRSSSVATRRRRPGGPAASATASFPSAPPRRNWSVCSI